MLDLPFFLHLQFNPFSAGTAFMLMQTGWIQASRRVTRRLAWDPTCLLLSPSFPITKTSKFKGFIKQTAIWSIFRKLPSIQRVKVPTGHYQPSGLTYLGNPSVDTFDTGLPQNIYCQHLDWLADNSYQNNFNLECNRFTSIVVKTLHITRSVQGSEETKCCNTDGLNSQTRIVAIFLTKVRKLLLEIAL